MPSSPGHEDGVVTDLSHSKADEVHDRVVVSTATPGRHVAVVTRGGDPVEEAQVERTGARLFLLHDDLRREELGATPALLLDQPVDVVAALLPRAQALDVMGEARELDYAGVADRDVAGQMTSIAASTVRRRRPTAFS